MNPTRPLDPLEMGNFVGSKSYSHRDRLDLLIRQVPVSQSSLFLDKRYKILPKKGAS
jgi:hypothetical protein